MKNKLDNWLCRASQSSKIMTGQLPVKGQYDETIAALESERDTLTNANGNAVKWTETKKEKLADLILKRETPIFKQMPKTFISELRKIHRQETYDRVFNFINKYVVKGIVQEDEAITLYFQYLNSKGNRVMFIKNEDRFTNEFIIGTPDLMPIKAGERMRGYDVKASWELDSFPFKDDDLISDYFWQNQSYMWLLDADEWVTAYCLVNLHEHGLNNEKNKYFYAYGTPQSPDDKHYDELIKQYRLLERRYIFDYDRFIQINPYHNMEITRDEWYGNNWDIPMEERIIEKTTVRCEESIKQLKERVIVAREYLNSL